MLTFRRTCRIAEYRSFGCLMRVWRGDADQRPDRGADVIGKGRPRGHQRGEFGIGDTPFALLATVSGTAPGRCDDA